MNIRTLEKWANGDEIFQFNFKKHSAILAGQTIVTVDSIVAVPLAYEEGVTPADVTITNSSISAAGDKVQATYSGGTASVTYSIECTCITSGALTIVMQGLLLVK